MSWELTRFVLTLRNLTPTEKAVAHSLACHAPKHGTAYPSMATIALESGLSNRTAAQKVVRRLEIKGIISPTTSKKGGRKNPTHYQFNSGNSIPTDALSGTVNSIPRDSISVERASLETQKSIPGDARSKGDKEAVATTAVSQGQMEKELSAVWTYYLDAFDKEEILSPSARRMGLAILSGIHKHNRTDPVSEMSCAVDMARHLAKKQPKKAYFENWFAIFGKWDTFVSLRRQYDSEDVPEYAHLPEMVQS
jgi:hypothetical protein